MTLQCKGELSYWLAAMQPVSVSTVLLMTKALLSAIFEETPHILLVGITTWINDVMMAEELRWWKEKIF